MLPTKVKRALLLAVKTNSDVEIRDNGKLTKVHIVCEIQSCVTKCNLRTVFIKSWTPCMFQLYCNLMFTIMLVKLVELPTV